MTDRKQFLRFCVFDFCFRFPEFNFFFNVPILDI